MGGGPILSNCTDLNGTNSLVTVRECSFNEGTGPISYGGTYRVSISGEPGTSEVTSFHVSTNNPAPGSGYIQGASSPAGGWDQGLYNAPFTTRQNWTATYYSASDWNGAFEERTGKRFGDLFGTDSGAYVYRAGWVSADNVLSKGVLADPLLPGQVYGGSNLMFGWYGGQPFSHFVALNGQTIVSQSLVTAPIPEPSAYALALAGLGVLGVCARRRRKA